MLTYLFRNGNTNLFKIGRTTNLRNRTNVLLNGNPDLKLLIYVNVDIEKELKLLLKEFHYKREHYKLNEEALKDVVSFFLETKMQEGESLTIK